MSLTPLCTRTEGILALRGSASRGVMSLILIGLFALHWHLRRPGRQQTVGLALEASASRYGNLDIWAYAQDRICTGTSGMAKQQ